jgi:hypothetical protein
MARSVVYRQVGHTRRTSLPRSRGVASSSSMGGLSMSFGRMLAKLSLASGSLQASRPRKRT